MSCPIATLHAGRDMERGGNCECEHCSNDCGCVSETAIISSGEATRALLEIKAVLMAFLDTDRDPPRDLLREYLRKTAEALNLALKADS